MAADLNLYSSDGLTLVSSFTITGGSPGVISDETAYRVVNDGPDSAPSPAIVARAQNEAGDYVLDGARPVDERWLEVRLTGVAATGVEVDSTGWTPIGFGRWFALPALAVDEWVEIEVRENRPGSAPIGEQSYELELEPGQIALSLDLGRSESYRDGVLTKIGRGFQWLLGGDIVEQTPSADDTVIVPDLFWIDANGVPHVKLTHDLTLNQDDGAAAALASGEAYWAVISLGASASPILTKGVKGTAPLAPEDAPDPSSGRAIARVHVEYGASGSVIQNADITMLEDVGGFHIVTTTGSRQILIGPGEAIVDNRLVRRTASALLTLDASETSHLWLLPAGTWSATIDGSKPESGALLRAVLIADATEVTSNADRRSWIGGEWVPVRFRISGAISVVQTAYALWAEQRTGYIWPLGLAASFSTFGAGNVSGSLAVDLLSTDGVGGAFTTHYTSQGTDDRRLVLDATAAEPVAQSGASLLPEVLEIAPLSRLQIETEITDPFDDGTSAADTNPEDLEVVVPILLV